MDEEILKEKLKKMVNYKRKPVVIQRYDVTDELTSGTLESLQQRIKELQSEGYTGYNFSQDWDNCALWFLKEGVEDDETYNARIKKEESIAKRKILTHEAKEKYKKEQEYLTYLELKKKFEPKDK